MDTIFKSLTKLLVFKITGLIFLLTMVILSQAVDFCKKDDQDIITETECDFGTLTLQTISVKEKDSVVKSINELRNKIAEGKLNLEVYGRCNVTLSQAASMTVIQWDNALEVAARKTIMDCNFKSNVIKIGQIQAVNPRINYQLYASLETFLLDKFFHHAKLFDVFKLTDYKSDPFYQYFTLLANHGTLFVGCAIANASLNGLLSICYFAPWEEVEHKILYTPGSSSCSDCPFKDVKHLCSTNYTSLCKRPPWGICDHQTQDASYMEGYENYKTSTTRTSTTELTTTESRSPKLVPSRYLPIIIFFLFLVQCL